MKKELCKTLGGRSVDMIKITNKGSAKKQGVVITARWHPGETVGSFVMEGFLKSIVKKDPIADYLRDKWVFYVVPMINPDGVFWGNNRTSLAGVDLNRRWAEPDKVMQPEVFYLKSFIETLTKDNISIFVDLHGHSKKNNSFIYGNSFKSTREKKSYWQVRFLSKILNKIAPMFSYDSWAFNNVQAKSSTARAVLGKQIGILNWFTLESSFHAFRYFNMANRWFLLCKYTIDDYNAMGDYLSKGIFGTIKAFYDNIDGIKNNPNVKENNIEIADNSIVVNALARKAHNEILNPTKKNKKGKTQRNSKTLSKKSSKIDIAKKPQTVLALTEDNGKLLVNVLLYLEIINLQQCPFV